MCVCARVCVSFLVCVCAHVCKVGVLCASLVSPKIYQPKSLTPNRARSPIIPSPPPLPASPSTEGGGIPKALRPAARLFSTLEILLWNYCGQHPPSPSRDHEVRCAAGFDLEPRGDQSALPRQFDAASEIAPRLAAAAAAPFLLPPVSPTLHDPLSIAKRES
jgi:hypothetical protein